MKKREREKMILATDVGIIFLLEYVNVEVIYTFITYYFLLTFLFC